MSNLWELKILFLLIFFNFKVSDCGENEGEQLRDFVPLPPREGGKNDLSMEVYEDSMGPSAGLLDFDKILADEVVSLEMSCERTLGSREESLRRLVMKSLDLDDEGTLRDLEKPSCRAHFDRNAHFFNKDQLAKLMATERGIAILREGNFMEFFTDYSDFTLEDFDRFPSLKVGRIRNLNSISAPVLLELVKQRGFSEAGKLERIPEAFGERILDHSHWKADPEIWQLFTIEGIVQVRNSFGFLTKFSSFLSAIERFQTLLFSSSNYYSSSSSSSSANACVNDSNNLKSGCKAMLDNSKYISRWVVQSEEFLLYLMELSEAGRPESPNYNIIYNSVENLMKTRAWLRDKFLENCGNNSQASASASASELESPEISETDSMRLASLKGILEVPVSWRLREALLLNIRYPNSISDPSTHIPTLTPMTRILCERLLRFRPIVKFFSSNSPHQQQQPINNDRLLTHFVLLNEISNLDEIFSEAPPGSNLSISEANEKFVLAIAIRRILLLLLSPTIDSPATISDSSSSSEGPREAGGENVIQDFLNYVFSSQSSSNTETLEIQRWFRHARDLSAIPVLDRLIQVFGHQINVSLEIQSMLNDPEMRMKLFTESKNAYVHLLVALSSSLTLSEHLVQATPKILVMPFLDPLKALLKLNVPDLPSHPKKQPHSQEELREHESKVDEVKNHNEAIANHLNTSLCFLNQFVSRDSDGHLGSLTHQFSIFIQPNFKIQYQDRVGVDVGGLRRTWLSALLRSFGDPERLLFPMHLDDGARVPAALLDPEIMSHLGAMHGKALQIGVRPDWFFTHTFSKNFLFAEIPEDYNAVELDSSLLTMVESWYPDIFKSLDLILECEDQYYALDYFNSSNFPTIEALNTHESAPVTDTMESVSAGEVAHNYSSDSADEQHLSLQLPMDTVENAVNVLGSTNFSSNSPISLMPVPTLNLQGVHGEQGEASPDAGHDVNTNARDAIGNDNGEGEGEGSQNDDLVIIHGVEEVNTDSGEPAPIGPPRHSFSRLLVFDTRYLSRKDIYNGPCARVESVDQISQYRTQLLHLFTRNLLLGRQKYWQTFGVFFDDRFRDLLAPDFLHSLFQSPDITIDQIISRIHFSRSCDTIVLIDDDGEEIGVEEETNSAELETEVNDDRGEDEKVDEGEDEEVDEGEMNDSENVAERTRPRRNRETESAPRVVKKSKSTSSRRLANITAKTALKRILSTSFTDRESIKSLLSFATGCPQIRPAGLDAFRLTVECLAAAPPNSVMSKSHTCFDSFDFVVSLKYSETKKLFIYSALDSSGFGFD